jgi:putative transposase
LRAPVRGDFFYLYLIVDVWSRKAVGARVHTHECGELASILVRDTLAAENADPETLAMHQDNGAPMKSATLKATLESLGVMASYSRPHVSDDNPFSESLFRTFKYWPGYPTAGFDSLEHAREWVEDFVAWYNTEHLHSGIGFVTPCERHEGSDEETLASRRAVYEAARQRHPERWSRDTRVWSSPSTVYLNPSKQTKLSLALKAQAA